MDMKDKALEVNGHSHDDPEAIVREAWQRAHAMGANDGEASIFQGIIDRLRGGRCTVEDAVREAEATVERKQSYH